MEIFGNYVSTTFRNEATGYTIFKIKLNNFIPEFDNIYVTCKGIISYSLICLPLKLVGTKSTDAYGDSFIVESVEPFVQNSNEAVDFLSSDCFKGISKKLAEKIVDSIGIDIFSLPEQPNAYSILTSIEGIGATKAKIIIETLSQAKKQKELLDYILPFGGNFITSEKMIIKYGTDALKLLKLNPYKVGYYCGLSFLSCDMIAKENNFTVNSEERIKALAMNVITRDYNAGNVYITIERLIKNINYLSSKQSAFNNCEVSSFQIITACAELKQVMTEIDNSEIRYYFKKSYEDELKIARNIRRLQKSRSRNDINIKKIINECESELNIKYSDKQKECFNFLRSNGIKIITGGPGTGKSTVINGLTYAYHKLYPKNNIVMMAPTGRAAQRINEITGKEAGTIHRMLGVCPFSDNSVQADYYADYPADMIIVDESSMIDNELMAILSECVKNNCLLIMVGDIDQLPSIGAGSVLRDIINANIETVMLDVNYRQKGKSVIIENAIAVNNGSFKLQADDCFKIETLYNAEDIAEKVKNTFLSLYDKSNPYSVQILCPQIKGQAGTYTINHKIQENISTGKTVIAHAYSKFKIGDKVMATKNNYEAGYFNGDVGLITDANEVTFTVKFSKHSLLIPRELIEDFQLAYACTIHKSQGSEYETIIICLPKEATCMMRRNLLYTAITRAKKNVLIFTQNNCVEFAISHTSTDKRISGLKDKLISELKVA